MFGIEFTHGEDSKLTGWFFEIDKGLLRMIFVLMLVGLLALVMAGGADATRLGHPWYYFIKKAFVPYSIGLLCLFGVSMLNKKQIIRISFVGVAVGVLLLFLTMFSNPFQYVQNGSSRWIRFLGQTVMPSDFLKPFFPIPGEYINGDSILREFIGGMNND